MNLFKAILLFLFVFFACVKIPSSYAEPSEPFENWLKQYGAWDQLEQEYAREINKDSPELILKRAEVLLNLNSPAKALELLEMTPSFSDNATEGRRLWTGGRAHRALGDLTKSVLWFTQSSKTQKNQNDKKILFNTEPRLETIWHDVWLKMYWSYCANHTISRDSQREALNQVLQVGKDVWGNSFWEKANWVVNPDSQPSLLAPSEANQLDADGLPISPLISKTDTELIVKALGAASLEKIEEAYGHINLIKEEPVRFFWTSFIYFLETGNTPKKLDIFSIGNYIKAQAFWAGNLLAPYSVQSSRSQWFLGNPDSVPWTKFRNNLLSMPIEEANKAIDNELGSMLISDQTASLLNNFKLAFSLSNGDFIKASKSWNNVEKMNLPITLQIAGMLLFKDNLNKILPQEPSESFKLYPIITTLSSAAGKKDMVEDVAPFWIAAPPEKLQNLSQNEWPMDKLLLLAFLKQQFDEQPSIALAKRSAFLFDDSSFGISSLLYLADESVAAKKLQLGAFYLNQAASSGLSDNLKVTWQDIKTRLELDSGRQDAALSTFKEMAAAGKEIPVMTRLRMALLFQQKKDFEAAKEQLVAMWNMREELTTALQAETLFWLGEGEQAVRNPDKALDYYLLLAWKYPEENIWALTAMYRASMIYEKRGKYDTAKRFLNTVISRADRKEQREAAKARINAIDKKMGKTSNSAKGLSYPF